MKMAVIDIVYSHIFDSVFYFLLGNIRILDHIYCLVYYFFSSVQISSKGNFRNFEIYSSNIETTHY